MLNQISISSVDQSRFSKCFTKPLYESFCFSKIPETILSLLTGEGEGLPPSCYSMSEGSYDGVVLFFLDAFGWSIFNRYKDHPFCRRFLQQGIVSKISTQFPSTTAAHVTTIHTGLEVGETGIYEWFQYEPLVDEMIAPLLFSRAGDPIHNSLLQSEHSVRDFFPFKTFYEKLHAKQIESYVFQDAGISGSPYSQALCLGAHPMAFLHLEQGLKDLQELLCRPRKNKLYAFFYYGNIDAMGHRKGITSSHFDRSVLHCLDLLEKEFMGFFSSLPKKTALLVTADHGMVDIKPKNTIYVNDLCKELTTWSQVNKKNQVLAPAGSCRDLFLHIKEEYIEIALVTLKELLKGKAEVWQVKELIQRGLFGRNVSARFLERVGNVVVLPYKGEAVWWFHPDKFSQNFYGAHGGLTEEESQTIFLFLSNCK